MTGYVPRRGWDPELWERLQKMALYPNPVFAEGGIVDPDVALAYDRYDGE